jgi:hypothetical protein
MGLFKYASEPVNKNRANKETTDLGILTKVPCFS